RRERGPASGEAPYARPYLRALDAPPHDGPVGVAASLLLGVFHERGDEPIRPGHRTVRQGHVDDSERAAERHLRQRVLTVRTHHRLVPLFRQGAHPHTVVGVRLPVPEPQCPRWSPRQTFQEIQSPKTVKLLVEAVRLVIKDLRRLCCGVGVHASIVHRLRRLVSPLPPPAVAAHRAITRTDYNDQRRNPASASTTFPVMVEASSPSSNDTTAPASAGVFHRPRGSWAATARVSSSSAQPVSVGPGLRQLTVIPSSTRASDNVNVS